MKSNNKNYRLGKIVALSALLFVAFVELLPITGTAQTVPYYTTTITGNSTGGSIPVYYLPYQTQTFGTPPGGYRMIASQSNGTAQTPSQSSLGQTASVLNAFKTAPQLPKTGGGGKAKMQQQKLLSSKKQP